MKNREFVKAVEEIRSINLTEKEKSLMLQNILKSDFVASPHSAVSSSYATKEYTYKVKSIYKFSLWLKRNSLATVLIMFFVLTATGRSMVVMAYGALPGDPLYAFKVNIVEPVKGNLLSTIAEKAQYQSGLVVSRLKEAETLALNGQLGSSVGKQISSVFSRNVTNLLALLGNDQKELQADKVRIATIANINAHARLLETISGSTSQQGVASNISSAAQKQAANLLPSSQIKIDKELPTVEPQSKDYAFQKQTLSERSSAIATDISILQRNILAIDVNSSQKLAPAIISQTEQILNLANSSLAEATKSIEKNEFSRAGLLLRDTEERVEEARVYLQAGLSIK